MTQDIEKQLTEDVIATIKCDNERSQQVLTSLVKHLHDFIRDIEPTEAEWIHAVEYLTRAGQKCDDQRQEYMLFSDVLGASMLVDAINHRFTSGATESTVIGPFHASAEEIENGTCVANGPEFERATPTVVHGVVRDVDGNPIEGAKLTFWQADDIGLYDSQDDNQPDINLRGILTSDAEGRYWFRTVRPTGYDVPTDGPVGEFLRECNRQAHRPGHIHFMIHAEGFRTLVTHVFPTGEVNISSDAVFGVKDSLVVDFGESSCEETAKKYSVAIPFLDCEFDFVLDKQAGAESPYKILKAQA